MEASNGLVCCGFEGVLHITPRSIERSYVAVKAHVRLRGTSQKVNDAQLAACPSILREKVTIFLLSLNKYEKKKKLFFKGAAKRAAIKVFRE